MKILVRRMERQMTNWEARFTRFYEEGDPHYEKGDSYLEKVMGDYICDHVANSPELVLDHYFARETTDWLNIETYRVVLRDYRIKLVKSREFAKAAVASNPHVIARFDLTEAPHYSEICSDAVEQSWRLIRDVNPKKCNVMHELAVSALNLAYTEGTERKLSGKSAKFLLRFVRNRLMPIAARAGCTGEEIKTWSERFNRMERS